MKGRKEKTEGRFDRRRIGERTGRERHISRWGNKWEREGVRGREKVIDG
jgi:hypothetical protein